MGFVTAHRRAARVRHGRPPALLATALGLACLAATIGAPVADAAPSAPSAPAAPAAITASGPFAADSDASLLTVDLPALAGVPDALLPQTNLNLANSVSAADSAGDPRTSATAGTTGSNVATTSILGSAVQLDSAAAEAPPSSVDDPGPTVPIPADPLLTLGLLDPYAEANWVSDTECVAGDTPLSLSDQQLASASVLNTGAPGSTDPADHVVFIGGPGAVSSDSNTFLKPIAGDNDPRAVYSSATASVGNVSLLMDNLAVTVERQGDTAIPDVVAQASGLAGGASVTFADNVATVTIGGDVTVTVDADTPQEAPIAITLGDIVDPTRLETIIGDLGLDPLTVITDPILNPAGDGLAELLAALQPIVALSIPQLRTSDPDSGPPVASADGTLAEGFTALLRVELLAPRFPDAAAEPLRAALAQVLEAIGTAPGETLGLIDLGPSHALAEAPLGGITCGADNNPLELQKVHSGPAIPGSSFDYTIAVGNVGDCAMDPVRVVDTLTGPAGSTIALTEPSATVTDQGGGTFQIVWDNVGPIPPDGRVSLRIRVNVPANATVGQRYSDTVTSTASIVPGEGCTARDVTRTVTLDEPAVIGARSGPCNITGSRKGKSHLEVYPGESFIYFINILNSGGEPCTGVTVVDPIDPRLTFESCSDGCTFSAPNATWNLGTLAPGQSVTLRLQVKVNQDATGTLENTGTIDTNETGPSTVHVDGPLVSDTSVLSGNTPAVVPDQTLARTGGLASWPVALTLGLLAFGAWHLRRRWAPVVQP